MDITSYLQKLRHLDPASHKGQNGKVLLIGGSELFHAASRWSLDVLSAMVDMVFYSSVPANNILIKEAKGQFWNGVIVPRGQLKNYLEEADVVLIGPGMTRDAKTKTLTNNLLAKYPHKKWVIDAGALQMLDPALLNSHCILTPHHAEYDQLLTRAISKEKLLSSMATILLKGPEDHILSLHQEETVTGGNAGMTKGGTGDVLAGLVAGLYAFTDDPFAAAVIASFVNKAAADQLYDSVGPFFITSQLVTEIPRVLKGALKY